MVLWKEPQKIEKVCNIGSFDYLNFLDADVSFLYVSIGILESLKNMKIVITKLDENDIEFDLMNVDVSLANALRRIFIAEVSQ